MRINEVLSNINKDNIDPVYLLKGNDYFLHSFFIQKISEILFYKKSVNRTLMVPDEMKGKEILVRLTTTDLFNMKKIFILRNPQQLKGKNSDDLISYCKAPIRNHVLIIILDDWIEKSAFAKKIVNILNPIDTRTPFPNQMIKWAQYFFRTEGKKVQSNVIETIVEMAGDSLAHLKNEIEKVCIWSGGSNTIKKQDLKQFSGWSRETQRWEFLIALGYQNLKDAIFLGKTIITQNENLISLLYPLTYLFQEILFLKMNRGTFHLNRGYMPISPSVKKRIPEFSKMYSKKKIILALNYLRDIDKRQKTTYISDETELLYFILHVIG